MEIINIISLKVYFSTSAVSNPLVEVKRSFVYLILENLNYKISKRIKWVQHENF